MEDTEKRPEEAEGTDTSFEDGGTGGTAPEAPMPDLAALIEAQNARIEELSEAVAAIAQSAQLGAALDADNGVGGEAEEEFPTIDLNEMTRMIGY